MVLSLTKNSSSLNTNSLPSSSSFAPSIPHSLFSKNIPSLSECRPSETLLAISDSIPKSEAVSFLRSTFADGNHVITEQDTSDMERFTLQDIQYLQSLFAKYKMTNLVNWNDVLGFDMYETLKQISSFFSQEKGDAFLRKWACNYLSSYILCYSDAIRFPSGVEEIRERNVHFASFKDYQRKLNELFQEMQAELKLAQFIDHSPIHIPESITTKNAKKKYVAEQQKIRREQRKMLVLDLINQWNVTAKLVVKFLDCSNPSVILTSLKGNSQSSQLNPKNPKDSLIVIRNLYSYMQMHIDCFTALIAEYPGMDLSVPQFGQQLLPLLKAMTEMSDLEQVYESCRHVSESIKLIKKPLSESIKLIKKHLSKNIKLVNKLLNEQVAIQINKAPLKTLAQSQPNESPEGLLSQAKTNQNLLTTKLLHHLYYNFFLLALYDDYKSQVELVMACLKPEFNNSLSNCHRIVRIISYSISNALSSPLMVRPLMELIKEFNEKNLKAIQYNKIDQYTPLSMQFNENNNLFYQRLKKLVDETFNEFIDKNKGTHLSLDENLPEEIICLLYAFTLLHDLGIVLEKEEFSNSSDLDILPEAFFDLFKLKDQEIDLAEDLKCELIADSQISLEDSGINKASDSSSFLIMPIDSKESKVSFESLETIDKIFSHGTRLDAVQEGSAKKLSSRAAHSNRDKESISIRSSSYLLPSSISTLRHESKKRAARAPKSIPVAPVLTMEAQSSISISESRAEALKDILNTDKRKKIEKILHQLGLESRPGKGGHTKWKDPTGTFGQTVTSGRDIPQGMRKAIVKQLQTASSHIKK
jgi:predicted RNA binding protein YcfA (HicA-like mRNA interferase family)